MSFVVTVALLLCSEILGSRPVFGEEGFISFFDDDDDWLDMEVDYINPFMEMDGFYYPLSPVNLTVDSMFNSLDSCNLTVTCSTYDSMLTINSTFKCENKTCYQEGGEQTESGWWWPSVSLHVYLSDGSIICNHSSKVNWTTDVIEIDHVCPQNAGSESFSDGVSVCMVKTVVFSVGLIIMVSAVISVHLIEKLQKQN